MKKKFNPEKNENIQHRFREQLRDRRGTGCASASFGVIPIWPEKWILRRWFLQLPGKHNSYLSLPYPKLMYLTQDTVYIANGIAYFANNYIQGAVDYIFGMRGVAYFPQRIPMRSVRGVLRVITGVALTSMRRSKMFSPENVTAIALRRGNDANKSATTKLRSGSLLRSSSNCIADQRPCNASVACGGAKIICIVN